MRLLRGEGAWLPGGRTRYRLERTPNRRDGAVTGRTVLGSGCCGERRGLRARELGDDAAALLPHPAGNGRGAVAALYQNRIPGASASASQLSSASVTVWPNSSS